MSVPQLPLALRYPPDQRFETFIGAPEGALPQLRAVANGGSQDWIYLVGAGATGKTHLALATCAAALQAGRRPAYLPLQAAGTRLQDALEALEGHDVLALDGLEYVAGRREQEITLFEFHNRARAADVTVIYTSRLPPDGLGLVLPDLRSRLSQCSRITLEPLDAEGRGAVLRERSVRRGLVMDEATLDWLLTRTGRDLSGLVTLLERLDRESLAAKKRITVPFLKRVLENGPG
ncbi:DnaA regulatory inactivator Hda [Stenotrophomonas sp. PS02298]|uniref:DnaA regulatory inactivator Hda n=1 Tax=Stenotrophomonas sp. PS02298 TaxID=2991424 RepID=UPI00249AF485|nr:DnaA regulatory inactivator Hda [Stenotrophomonas sp. PS02298]